MSLRRSARLHIPAISPEERMVPLVERGRNSRSGNSGPQESHPGSPVDGPGDAAMSVLPFTVESDVNEPNHGSSGLPEPLLVPTQPVTEIEPEEREVLLEAFNDFHYQQMLQEASTLYPFGPNTIIGTVSIPEEALPASEPRHTETATESSHMGNGVGGAAGVNDVNVNAVQQQSAVALALQGEPNSSFLTVTLMNLSQPTTNEILNHLTNSTEANTRALCQQLDALPSGEVNVGTARKPVFIGNLHTHRGDPNVRYRVLGTMEEVRNDADKYLMPCIDCPEADSYRQFPEPPISSSIPLLILYFERQDASATTSNMASTVAMSPNMASTAATSTKKTRPMLEDGVGRYLKATIDSMLIGVYHEHVVRYRLTHKAYSTIIMARLIETACIDVNVNYDTGNARSHKNQTYNGPDVALDDVVLFFMDQMPPNLKTTKGMTTAPSTFSNYRTWHLRAKDCLAALEGKCVPEGNNSEFVELVKKLLDTKLTNLGVLDPKKYGSWERFTERICLLKDVAEGKTGTA
ncbi:hypothetical protein F5887DRAFT_922205 [Amanita rubescens]|nr:hypothetical protein F5887DRAFT_922205 [Amanita rubescens]